MALVPSNDVWETLAYCYSTRRADAERVGAWLDLPAIGGRRRLAKWYERLARRVRKPTKLLVPTIVTAVVLSIGAMIGGGFLVAWLGQFQKVRWTFGIIGGVLLAYAIMKRPRARHRRARWALLPRVDRWRLAVQARQRGEVGEAARAELAMRRRMWEDALRKPPSLSRTVGIVFSRDDMNWVFGIFVLASTIMIVFASSAGSTQPPRPAFMHLMTMLSFAAMASYLLPWIAGWWTRRWLHRRAVRVLRESACPDCDYDLRGVPYGITAAPEFGPRRCPECMLRWPLVPPRAPGGHGTIAQHATAPRDSANPFTSQ